MAFKDLREFIAFLESQGQLRRIATEVTPELEITEITDRVCKSESNLALLFENVRDYQMPVLTNAFGSYERMAWALGVDKLSDLTERIASLVSMKMPGSILDKLQHLGEILEAARYAPRTVNKAPVQEVVNTERLSLEELPVLHCWPEDGGRFITLPLVFTRDPETGRRNVGMYRMQVYNATTTGMHWHIHKGGAEHYREAERRHQRIEVAVALGGDPATIYAATAPLPKDVDEMLFAGWLRKERVEMAPAITVDLEVPAHAEIVLEGYVNPNERRLEGPFGDHTGYYSVEDMYPVFHLTAITHRADAIYPATIVGPPPMEDCYLAKATERLFLPLIQLIHPEIVDINLPLEGVFHNLAIVSIHKSYPGQPKKVMYGLWGLMLMMLTKNIVVVDDYVNVQDLSEVLWRLTNNIDPRRDVVIVDGPLDALDHASPTPHYGSKMGFDATRKGLADGHPRPWPNDIRMTPEIKDLVDRKWAELGL